MSQNRNAEYLKPDELEQVCGGYDLTKANDYHHDLEIFIQVATKKLDALDMSTPEGIAAEKQARTIFEERIAFITREARLYGAAPPVVPPIPG